MYSCTVIVFQRGLSIVPELSKVGAHEEVGDVCTSVLQGRQSDDGLCEASSFWSMIEEIMFYLMYAL